MLSGNAVEFEYLSVKAAARRTYALVGLRQPFHVRNAAVAISLQYGSPRHIVRILRGHPRPVGQRTANGFLLLRYRGRGGKRFREIRLFAQYLVVVHISCSRIAFREQRGKPFFIRLFPRGFCRSVIQIARAREGQKFASVVAVKSVIESRSTFYAV